MLVLIKVHNIGSETLMTIAVDPWKVEYIRPAYMEDDVCYLNCGGIGWRVGESFEDVIRKINDARKGDKQ